MSNGAAKKPRRFYLAFFAIAPGLRRAFQQSRHGAF
jgi:hypothetical protein